jgi:hypothetical protein
MYSVLVDNNNILYHRRFLLFYLKITKYIHVCIALYILYLPLVTPLIWLT